MPTLASDTVVALFWIEVAVCAGMLAYLGRDLWREWRRPSPYDDEGL